ncbi:hypothetical protein [Halobacillus ihumii]|uniref:hypothetical protein n=1 Tax=Halobacillus ihumii TaxID=2686092 RepID=UPI0013D3F49D|nr:hypothetical protein [Halobacillus ihumii]
MNLDSKAFISLTNEQKKEMLDMERQKADLESLVLQESCNYQIAQMIAQIEEIKQQQKAVLNQHVH